MSRCMHVLLVGMCVALERQKGLTSCAAVFDSAPDQGGTVVDASYKLFAQEGVLGLNRAQLTKLFPNSKYAVIDCGSYGDDYNRLAEHCAQLSPHVELEECNRVFLSMGSNQGPHELFASLTNLVPEWGHTLLGTVAPSKYLARAALLYVLRNAGKDAASYTRAHKRGQPFSRVSTANRAYGRSTSVTLELSRKNRGPAAPASALEQRDFQQGTLFELSEDGVQTFLQGLPLTFLWPLSPELRERLRRLGFESIGQLASVSRKRLRQLLGPCAEKVHHYSRGLDWRGLRPNFPKHRYIQSLKFGPEEHVSTAAQQQLSRAVTGLAAKLQRLLSDQSHSCGELTLTAVFRSGKSWSQTHSFTGTAQGKTTQPNSFARGLQVPALTLLHSLLETSIEQELAALKLQAGELRPLVPEQLSLEKLQKQAPLDSSKRQLDELLAAIKSRFPDSTLYMGGQKEQLSRREQMLELVDPYRQLPDRSREG